MNQTTHDPVIAANIEVHTKMASTYNANEPHFRPENQARVRQRVQALRAASGPKLLDIGCGTGFVLDLAHDLFDELTGIDITQAMLDLVNLRGGKVKILNCPVEAMPFSAASFDAVSSYAFIHHVRDYRLVLKEVARVLRPGGRFYLDLEPNKLFWKAMVDLEGRPVLEQAGYSAMIQRQINSVLHTDDRVEEEFGISKDVFNNAEYTKSILGGIDPYEFSDACLSAGFAACEVVPTWFLGEEVVLHGKSEQAAADVDAYLRMALPMSAPFYKYLQFNVTR